MLSSTLGDVDEGEEEALLGGSGSAGARGGGRTGFSTSPHQRNHAPAQMYHDAEHQQQFVSSSVPDNVNALLNPRASAGTTTMQHAESAASGYGSYLGATTGSVGSLTLLDLSMYIDRQRQSGGGGGGGGGAKTTATGFSEGNTTPTAGAGGGIGWEGVRRKCSLPPGYGGAENDIGDEKVRRANTMNAHSEESMYSPVKRIGDGDRVNAEYGAATLPYDYDMHSPTEFDALAKQQLATQQQQQQQRGDASSLATTFNVVNLYVGLGLLSKPYALRLGGWLSLIVLFACTALFNFTGKLLVRCFDAAPHVQSFVGLGLAAGGKWGLWTVGIVSIADFFSAVCMCLIIVWNSVDTLVTKIAGTDSWWITPCINVVGLEANPAMLACALALVPFLCVRSFGKMSFISAVGVVCNVLITAVVAVAALEGTEGGRQHEPSPLSADELIHWKQLPISVGIYVLSLAGHPSLPSLRKSMRHPEHFERMLDGSFAIMFVVYVAMAVFGYLSFGDASAVLVTDNLSAAAHSPASRILNKVVIFFVALSSASTIPPLIAVTVEMYDDITDNLSMLARLSKGTALAQAHQMSPPTHIGSCLKRMFVLALVVLVAIICAGYLGSFESVFGGICAINGSMILPAVFYMMLVGKRLTGWQRFELRAIVAIGGVMLVSICAMNIADLMH